MTNLQDLLNLLFLIPLVLFIILVADFIMRNITFKLSNKDNDYGAEINLNLPDDYNVKCLENPVNGALDLEIISADIKFDNFNISIDVPEEYSVIAIREDISKVIPRLTAEDFTIRELKQKASAYNKMVPVTERISKWDRMNKQQLYTALLAKKVLCIQSSN